MERSNLFVQAVDPQEDLSTVLFRPEVMSTGDDERKCTRVIIRRERQIFRKLPKTNAILFSVATSLTDLEDLGEQELRNLAREVRAWPEEMARYKGRHFWGDRLLSFCEKDN